MFGSGGNSQPGPNGGSDVQSVVQGNSGTESDSEIEVDLNLAYDRIFEQVQNFVRKEQFLSDLSKRIFFDSKIDFFLCENFEFCPKIVQKSKNGYF